MKIILLGCLTVVLLCACGDDTVETPNPPPEWLNEPGEIDPFAVELALIQALGKKDFTKDDLETVTRLRVSGGFPGYVTDYDFTLLADCINLMELELSLNISDLSPLAGFTRLTTLNLSGNQISDISPLTDKVNLQRLILAHNPITNLRPLAGLVKLQYLDLSHTQQITDLRPLAGLVNLQHLDLQHNRIVDITPLKGLTQLEKLYLNSNQIVDLKPLVKNPGLVNENPVHLEGGFDIRADVVGVGDNPLSDVSRDEHIPALEARGVIVRH